MVPREDAIIQSRVPVPGRQAEQQRLLPAIMFARDIILHMSKQNVNHLQRS